MPPSSSHPIVEKALVVRMSLVVDLNLPNNLPSNGPVHLTSSNPCSPSIRHRSAQIPLLVHHYIVLYLLLSRNLELYLLCFVVRTSLFFRHSSIFHLIRMY